MPFSDQLRNEHKTKSELENEARIARYNDIINLKDRIINEFKHLCLSATRNSERCISHVVDVCPHDREYGGYGVIKQYDLNAAKVLCEKIKSVLAHENFEKLNVGLFHFTVDKTFYLFGLFPIKYEIKDKSGNLFMRIDASWYT
ncbi:MAG: hypothetical protein FWC95_03535 [Defluviitaleaceae bacterium]|nr:hypothetical protein [Defluviitaleaceae bacterium]